MQLEGATKLERELYDVCREWEGQPCSELQTRVSVALSNASNELQRLREQCSTCERGFAAAMDELILALPQASRELKPGTVACVKAYIAHLEQLESPAS